MAHHEELHNDILAFKPVAPGDGIVHAIVLKHLDDLINARRSRQHMMGSSLNAIIWVVLLVLTALTVVSCYFVGSHGIRVQMTLTGFVGASIGAMRPVPFQRVLDDLDRADTRPRS